jgi:hypothetical protein
LFIAEITRDDGRARPREAKRNGLANAARTACNQIRFAAQREQIGPVRRRSHAPYSFIDPPCSTQIVGFASMTGQTPDSRKVKN